MRASNRATEGEEQNDYLQSMKLDQLIAELRLRVNQQEVSRKIDRAYPYWGESVEAIILEGLIRGSYKLMEGDESQLRCSIRAFDQWKGQAKKSQKDILVLSEEELSSRKKLEIIDALETEIDRLKEKYSIIEVLLARDLGARRRFYIFKREYNAPVNMTAKEVESVINHIMRLDKLCVELKNKPMSEKKLKQRIFEIINEQFYSGGLKKFEGETQGGQEIPNLKKLLQPGKSERGERANQKLEVDLKKIPIGFPAKNKIVKLLNTEMLRVQEKYKLLTITEKENNNLLLFFNEDGSRFIPDDDPKSKINIVVKRLREIDKVIQFLKNDVKCEYPSWDYHAMLLELKTKMIPTNPKFYRKDASSCGVIDDAIKLLPVKMQSQPVADQKQEQGKESGMSRSVSWLGGPGGR